MEPPAKSRRKSEVAVLKREQGHGPAPVPARVEQNGTLALLQTVERLSTNPATNPAIVEMLLKEMKELRAEQARSTFDAQMALMQPELPVIVKKGKIVVKAKDAKGERTGAIIQSTSYALWEDVVEEVMPILGKYGFSLQFKTGITEKGLVRVVGILAGHGHRELSDIELQHDSSGSKNSVQAVMSSISYGKRHVAGALVNIVARGEDDDGTTGGKVLVVGEPLSAKQLEEMIAYCGAVECPKPYLLQHINKGRPKGHPEISELEHLPASRFDQVMADLASYDTNRRAAEKRKAEVSEDKR